MPILIPCFIASVPLAFLLSAVLHFDPKSINRHILESFHQESNLFLRFPASRRVELQLDVESGLICILDILCIALVDLVYEVFKLQNDAVVDGGLDALVVACGVGCGCGEDEGGVGLGQECEYESEENYDC